MRPESDPRKSESMRFFPALGYTFIGHIRSVPHERKKIGFGSLEPCSVNEARRISNKPIFKSKQSQNKLLILTEHSLNSARCFMRFSVAVVDIYDFFASAFD